MGSFGGQGVWLGGGEAAGVKVLYGSWVHCTRTSQCTSFAGCGKRGAPKRLPECDVAAEHMGTRHPKNTANGK